MMEFEKLIGLKVSALKHFRRDKRKKRSLRVEYIMFDDGQTYIELQDQDCYTYHDYATSAKHISIMQDPDHWKRMMEDNDSYPDANDDP